MFLLALFMSWTGMVCNVRGHGVVTDSQVNLLLRKLCPS